MKKLSEVWGKLPAEVKVALYLSASYGLSAIIIELSKVQISNVWLAIALNIFLVFLKEIKPRIEKLQAEK
jgi:hypothetical protein